MGINNVFEDATLDLDGLSETSPPPSEDPVLALIKRVAGCIRVTKVVATRSIKTKNGDHFVAFAAGWDTVQDDAGGPGADTELVMGDREIAANGLTLKEAEVAQLLVGLKTNLAVYQNARAAGTVEESTYNQAVKALKNNFSLAVRVAAEAATNKE